jgi:hypothetical protein
MKHSTISRYHDVIEARVLGLGVVTGKRLSYDIADPAGENVCFVLKMYAGGVGNGIMATNGKRYYNCRYTKWGKGRPLDVQVSGTMVSQGTKDVINQVIREWREKNG